MRPVNTVEDEGFKTLMYVVQPGYTEPKKEMVIYAVERYGIQGRHHKTFQITSEEKDTLWQILVVRDDMNISAA